MLYHYFGLSRFFLKQTLDIHSVLSKTLQLLLKLYSIWQFTDWVQYCTINSIETLQFRTHLWIWITARVIDRELKKAFWEIPLSVHNCVLWSSCLVTNKGLKPGPSMKIFSSPNFSIKLPNCFIWRHCVLKQNNNCHQTRSD